MDDRRLNAPDVPAEDLGRELAGDKAEGDDRAWLTEDELDEGDEHEELTDTELYELDDGQSAGDEMESLTESGLRSGETANADIASDEGLPWVPPIDPPVIPSETDRQGIEVAAGFGITGFDEEVDEEHRGEDLNDESEMSALVREALRADAASSRFADQLVIATIGGVVVLRGVVDDIEDSDNVVDVAGRVAGVVDVIDEMDVRALE